MSAWLPGSGSYLVIGNILYEVRIKSGLPLNLVGYIIHAGATCYQGLDLLDGRVFNGEVLIQIFSVTPHIALEKFNALHFQENLNCVGHGLYVRSGNLYHLQARGFLDQVEEVHI
jgi:hypothetical protein